MNWLSFDFSFKYLPMAGLFRPYPLQPTSSLELGNVAHDGGSVFLRQRCQLLIRNALVALQKHQKLSL